MTVRIVPRLYSINANMSRLYAGQHNDSRMNVALIMTAVRLGAIVANHCEVIELHKGDAGKLIGARVKDNLTGKEWDIRAKVSSAFLPIIDLFQLILHCSGHRQCHWAFLR